MARILFFLVLVIDVLVVWDILKGNKDDEKKMLWIIAVVFLPVIGPVLYYFIGTRR
jgi:hypothetical protein